MEIAMLPLTKGFLYTTCCALALAVPANILAQSGDAASRSQTIASAELPDSPGAARSAQDTSTPQQSSSSQTTPATGQPQPAAGTTATAPQNTASQDQEQKPQRPVGTAAAEAPRTKGVTAAQPSGVAIAPAKQHRVRTIVIKVGAIVAAGAAVGTVIALTE